MVVRFLSSKICLIYLRIKINRAIFTSFLVVCPNICIECTKIDYDTYKENIVGIVDNHFSTNIFE